MEGRNEGRAEEGRWWWLGEREMGNGKGQDLQGITTFFVFGQNFCSIFDGHFDSGQGCACPYEQKLMHAR